MSEIVLKITSPQDLTSFKNSMVVETANPARQAQILINFLRGLKGGCTQGTIQIQEGPVKATGTITMAGADAADTVVVDGISFLAVASGATGNQFNVGVRALLVNQNLTFTAVQAGTAGNSITMALTAGATAGAEVVTVVGNAISVQIQDGVSSADQIKTALLASGPATALIGITGSSASASTLLAITPLATGTGTNTTVAASLASALNANATLDGRMTATSAIGVVTIEADEYGEPGNSISMTKTGAGITLSGAELTGGTSGTTNTYF